MHPSPPALVGGARASRAPKSLRRAAAAVVLGSAILALSAHVQVPFWPVRLSMQSFVVLGLGFALGGRSATAALLLYLAEGAIGLPVFQGLSGPAAFAGPTGGYLVGYLLAAAAVGRLADRGWAEHRTGALAAVAVGEALIYAPGVLWLAALFGAGKAVAYGLAPFAFGEALKAALLLAAVPPLRRARARS